MTMAEAVYLLCAATSAGCAFMLWRQFRQIKRYRGTLLLWSSICFSGLAVSNAILFIDLVVVPATDLSLIRAGVGATSVTLLVMALIWALE